MNGYSHSLQSHANSDIKPENLSSSSDGQLGRHGHPQEPLDVKPNIFNLKNEFSNHSAMHHSKHEYNSKSDFHPSIENSVNYESESYHRQNLQDDRDHCEDAGRGLHHIKGAEGPIVDMMDDEDDDIEEAENLSLNNNGSNADPAHAEKIN